MMIVGIELDTALLGSQNVAWALLYIFRGHDPLN